MAEEMEQGERTFDPTPLRLAEAARRGRVVRSQELTGSLVMLGALGVLALAGPALLKSLVKMTGAMLDQSAAVKGDAWAMVGMKGSAWPVLWPLLAMACAMIVLAAAVNVLQVGLPRSAEQVRIDWQRVSASAGWRRLWSARTMVRCALLLARLASVGAAAYFVIRGALPRIASAGQAGVNGLTTQAGELVWQLTWRAGLALLALGVLDYLYQRWQHRRDLRMSHRELRDDLRQMEGDPNVRGRQKAMRKQNV